MSPLSNSTCTSIAIDVQVLQFSMICGITSELLGKNSVSQCHQIPLSLGIKGCDLRYYLNLYTVIAIGSLLFPGPD